MKKIFLAMAIAIVTGTAVSAQDDDKEDKIVVSTHQTDKEDGYEGHRLADAVSNQFPAYRCDKGRTGKCRWLSASRYGDYPKDRPGRNCNR